MKLGSCFCLTNLAPLKSDQETNRSWCSTSVWVLHVRRHIKKNVPSQGRPKLGNSFPWAQEKGGWAALSVCRPYVTWEDPLPPRIRSQLSRLPGSNQPSAQGSSVHSSQAQSLASFVMFLKTFDRLCADTVQAPLSQFSRIQSEGLGSPLPSAFQF
jgi:hypothetical protein